MLVTNSGDSRYLGTQLVTTGDIDTMSHSVCDRDFKGLWLNPNDGASINALSNAGPIVAG